MDKIREISLDNCKKIAQGGYGEVFRYDEETIVKMYKEGYTLSEVERECVTAKEALKLGVPTAISFGIVKCGERYGMMYEMMDSGTLSEAIVANPEKMNIYMKKYVDLFNELHSIHDTNGVFKPLKKMLNENIDRMDRFCEPGEQDIMREIVASIKDSDTLVHGDFHPGNIMVHGDELMLIDVSGMVTGSMVYDAYSIFRDLIACPKNNEDMCKMSIGLNAEYCSKVSNTFFAMYLGTSDPEKIGEYMKRIGLVYSFFIPVFLGEENLHPRAEAGAPIIMEKLFRGSVVPNKDAIKMILSNM